MIITESFVWINFPKTASTFVRECLREIYTIPWWNLAKKKRFKGRWMKELKLPVIWWLENPLQHGRCTPHGYFRQIPMEYQHLPVNSALRDPLERYLSLYFYGQWKKNEAISKPIEVLKKSYPRFPDLSLEEYIQYMEENRKEHIYIGESKIPLGFQSHDLINFFCSACHIKGNDIVFKDWNDLAEIFVRVNFFKKRTISNDLHSHLMKYGFQIKDTAFILKKQPVNQSKKNQINITDAMENRITAGEWLLEKLYQAEGRISAAQLQAAAASI